MNDVRISGLVKRTWTHSGILYARLAVRRDRGRPRRDRQAGGNYDYMTVALGGSGSPPPDLQPGQRLSVHGWVQSRDFDESLADFLARAEGGAPPLEPALAERIVVHRSVTEIVAERWRVEDPL